MTDVVERVARALHKAEGIQGRPNMEHYSVMARAAIEAMREPSPEVTEAIWQTTNPIDWAEAEEIWDRAIDAALKGEQA